MTAVNSKPTDPRLAKREELSETDLRVEYMKHCRAFLIGTRAQLEAEGIPEISDKWPLQKNLVRWVVGDWRFSMEEETRVRLRKLYGRVPSGPRYRVWVERATADYGMWARAEMLSKLEEMDEIRRRWSDERTAELHYAFKVREDARFMAHMGAMLAPTMPRKGGRRRSASASVDSTSYEG